MSAAQASKGTLSNKNGASLTRTEDGKRHGVNDVTEATKHKAPVHDNQVFRQLRVVLWRFDDMLKTSTRKRKYNKDEDSDDDDDLVTRYNMADGGLKTVYKIRKLNKANDSEVVICPQEDDADLKKVKFKGPVPVDKYCNLTEYHVYIDKTMYSKFNVHNAMLSQTNIGFNSNKYYLVQLLEHDTKYEYATWYRWGRIGKIAGTTLKHHGANLEAAKAVFKKKFEDKTGNSWDHLVASPGENFVKLPHKHDLLQMDYGKDVEEKRKMKRLKKEKQDVPSKLDPRVEEIVDLIFNVNEDEARLNQMKYDVAEGPLGKLTKKQIKAGYRSLKKIEKLVAGRSELPALLEACSEFYTRVPHDFGMEVPPMIFHRGDFRIEMELLKALSDIRNPIEMIDEDQFGSEMSIKDYRYKYLGCKLDPLDAGDGELKHILDYVANSNRSTLNQWKLTVENAYQIHSEQSSQFKEEIGNKMLLWHGSRLTNWAGILREGLKIAPPEAPLTGNGMFGKGIYFSDIVSKSAKYCRANPSQPCGLLLLCEVALGNTNDKVHADYYADILPKGKSSTKGLGKEVPDPKGNITLDCGTVAPLGELKMLDNQEDYYLLHNEYVVYDVNQIVPRYLVRVKFDFVI